MSAEGVKVMMDYHYNISQAKGQSKQKVYVHSRKLMQCVSFFIFSFKMEEE